MMNDDDDDDDYGADRIVDDKVRPNSTMRGARTHRRSGAAKRSLNRNDNDLARTGRRCGVAERRDRRRCVWFVAISLFVCLFVLICIVVGLIRYDQNGVIITDM